MARPYIEGSEAGVRLRGRPGESLRHWHTGESIWRSSVALVCLTLAVLGTNPMAVAKAPPPSTLEDIRRAGVLVAGISRDLPPFARQGAGGKLAGFDVDLIDGLARELGVQVTYVPLSGAARITAVQAGTVHVTAATLAATPEHRRLVDFSTTYFHDARRILVRRDSTIAGPEDLAGLSVGVAPGPSGRDLLHLVPTAVPISFASSHAALPALMSGRIDAIAAEISVLGDLLGRLARPDSLHMVGDPFTPEEYALALPKGDGRWQLHVNSYLSELETAGRWEAMVRKWFGDRAPLPSPHGHRPEQGSGR